MKIYQFHTEKRVYFAPMVERITLDNDISLQLQSEPPTGPNEGYNSTPKYYNNEPFKSNMA